MPVVDDEQNKKKCLCLGCFSDSDFRNEEQGLFCVSRKGNCQVKSERCLCLNCPVYLENNLEGFYFCQRAKD